MRVYLAARYSRLEELQGYRDDLAWAGIDVTSHWLEGNHQATDADLVKDRKLAAGFAGEDWDDLTQADVVVCFTEEPRSGPTRGGRHVEAGIALGHGIPVIVVGPIENVFYALARVTVVHDWADALSELWRRDRLRREGERDELFRVGTEPLPDPPTLLDICRQGEAELDNTVRHLRSAEELEAADWPDGFRIHRSDAIPAGSVVVADLSNVEPVDCENCKGGGLLRTPTGRLRKFPCCPDCNGYGKVKLAALLPCELCGGKDSACIKCHGSGTVSVYIPIRSKSGAAL